jgi:anti-sigma factor RsiW
MNCSDISAFAPLYLTGELEAVRAQNFAAHIKVCPACRRELEQQQAFDDLMRTALLAEEVDNAPIDQRVRAVIQSDRRVLRRRILATAGIAAVLVLAALGSRMIFRARTTPVYAAAARDHRLEIVDRQPRKWFTDRAAIEALAGRQGLSNAAVTALAPAGYRIAQGKLCMLDGRIFLHLVYVNDAGNFSVFLRRPGDVAEAGAIHADTIAAQHVAGFERGPWDGLIVTEQAGDAASRLATLAAAAL